MDVSDRVYGNIKIKESVLIKLINSEPVQRLKGINQAGASQYAIKGKDVTRYEHSIGVMILLKKLDASIEELVAGLLHDIPHTAFSHVIDFVFTSERHDFHEKFHKKMLTNSKIPSILKEHGFSVKRILNDHNFSLLEREIPDLCADRVDYTLRDMVASFGYEDKIKDYINNLTVRNGEIIFKSGEVAKRFGKDYLMMGRKKWSHPLEVALFQILADAIKIALHEKILAEGDLFRDDAFVYNKLKDSGNNKILEKLSMLNPNLRIADNYSNYDFYTRSKLRYVDPKFLETDNSVRRVSEVFKDFGTELAEYKEFMKRGNFIKIISW